MKESGQYCINCMKKKEGAGACPYCGFDAGGYMPRPHQLPPETILYGKYLIGRVLGEGGFGITYKGWDLALEVMVAVKEYYPVGMVTRDNGVSNVIMAFSGEYGERFRSGRNRFIREARSLAKFESLKEIVKVRDFFMENNTSYIVMEFLDGIPLNRYVEQAGGTLGEKAVFSMMEPVVRALGQVHGAGLIHRDISPDNLMVMEDKKLKLLDFGAVRDIAADGGARSRTLMLKLGYAPEEQYHSNGNQGPWTDVYALCATMYYCITGMVPPESLDRSEEDTLAPFAQLGLEVEPDKAAALYKGLNVMAQDRYRSMEELHEALYGNQRDVKFQLDEKRQLSPAQNSDVGIEKWEGGPADSGRRAGNETGGGTDAGRNRKAVKAAWAAVLGVSVLYLAVGCIFTVSGFMAATSTWAVIFVLWAVTAAGFYNHMKHMDMEKWTGRNNNRKNPRGEPESRNSARVQTGAMADETVMMGTDEGNIYYLEYQEGGKLYRVPLEKERTVIGRLAEEVDIAVDNRRVGKVHAQIIVKKDGFYLCDLNSKNGTYLNGSARRIPANTLCPVRDGDRITLADSDFYLKKG